MKNKKQYRNVAQMLDGVSEDRNLRDELESYGNDRQLTQFLAATRCAKRLSQEDIANKLGRTQSCISKLENGIDADLKFGEVDSYLGAMGLKASILIGLKNATTLDDIKYHVYSIKNRLEEMAELSQPGDGSAESVAATHFETLVNMAQVVVQSVEKIPLKDLECRPFCRLELGFFPEDEASPMSLGHVDDDCAAST